MARFNAENIDNYGAQPSGKTNYFSLKNDGDVARVRFMYSGADDIEGISVHKVSVGDRERYVNCLREYNEPLDNCPFCREHLPVQAKLFVPIYNEDVGAVQIWERGRSFYKKLSSLAGRYPNLVGTTCDIERNGKAGDQKTTYEVYPIATDDTKLEDLPELPEIFGGLVLDKTAEEMEEYLEIGSFPTDSAPISRRQTRQDTTDESPRRTGGRRTPTNRGNGDRF